MPTKKDRRNIGLKVLSVVLAFTLWLFVTYRGQTEVALEAPIEFRNIPKELEVVKQGVKKVNVTLRGYERALQDLRVSGVLVAVDLSNAKLGEMAFYLNRSDVDVPGTVKVLRIEPVSVRVTLDEHASKTVTVRPTIVGSPGKGYTIAAVDVKPPSVQIEGARAEVDKVSLLRTEPLDLSGIDETITQAVRINTGGRNVRMNVAEVTATITIKRKDR